MEYTLQITNERDTCSLCFALPSNNIKHIMLSVRIHRDNGCYATTLRSTKLNSKWQYQNKTEMKVNAGNTQLCSYTLM